VSASTFDLYLVTDRTQTNGRDLLWILERALDGGVKAIQLREKDLPGKELLDLAIKTNLLCQRYNAELFINDRIDVALAVNAAGVQLGRLSLPLETARSLLGPNKTLGFSAHTLGEAQQAQRSGADFILFGPVYFTSSKAQYGPPQGLAALKKTVENLRVPVYAIGGIKHDNLLDAMNTGIRGAALISGILSVPDPTKATQQILNLLSRGM
jgi:thiamine-phosphate pyrophosphorylase